MEPGQSISGTAAPELGTSIHQTLHLRATITKLEISPLYLLCIVGFNGCSSIRILNLESFLWTLLFSSVFSNTSKFSPMFCRSPSHCIYLYFRWSHTSSSGVADLLPLSSVSAPLERVWSTLSIEWVWLGCWGAWSVCCWGVWSCIL